MRSEKGGIPMEAGKQYHIALGPGDVGRYVLLPGDPGRTELIAKFFDEAKEVAFNREYRTFTGYITGYDGKKIKISTTSTGIGCPSTAICVEELIKIGADTFISWFFTEGGRYRSYCNIYSINKRGGNFTTICPFILPCCS